MRVEFSGPSRGLAPQVPQPGLTGGPLTRTPSLLPPTPVSLLSAFHSPCHAPSSKAEQAPSPWLPRLYHLWGEMQPSLQGPLSLRCAHITIRGSQALRGPGPREKSPIWVRSWVPTRPGRRDLSAQRPPQAGASLSGFWLPPGVTGPMAARPPPHRCSLSPAATDQPHPGVAAGAAQQAAEPAAVAGEGGGGVQELPARRPHAQNQGPAAVRPALPCPSAHPHGALAGWCPQSEGTGT